MYIHWNVLYQLNFAKFLISKCARNCQRIVEMQTIHVHAYVNVSSFIFHNAYVKTLVLFHIYPSECNTCILSSSFIFIDYFWKHADTERAVNIFLCTAGLCVNSTISLLPGKVEEHLFYWSLRHRVIFYVIIGFNFLQYFENASNTNCWLWDVVL